MTPSALWKGRNRPLDDRGLFESTLTRAIIASLAVHALAILVPGYGKLSPMLDKPDHPRAVLRATLQHERRLETPQHTPSLTDELAASVPEGTSPEPPPEVNQSEASERPGLDWNTLRYYAVNEVDLRPQIRLQPQLENSIPASTLLATGSAKIELLVERTGQINAVNILESNLPAAYNDRLQEAFKKMEYSPGFLDAHAVRTRIVIEVSYIDGEISDSAPSMMQAHPSTPHTPIELTPERHKRKSNPSSMQQRN